MTCCIVGFLILAAVGRVRRALGRSGAAPMLFAPVARRPAPGEVLPIPVDRIPVDTPSRATRPAAVFRYAALGIGVCLLAAPLLVWTGVAHGTGSAWMWLLRSAVYLAVLSGALALSRSVAIRSAPRGAGALLVVVGAVILELGIVDMHVFGVLDFEDNPLWDFTFHAIGPAIATLGGLVLLYGSRGRSMTSRRSARSTVTSAQPSSPAVTLSSTPPITT